MPLADRLLTRTEAQNRRSSLVMPDVFFDIADFELQPGQSLGPTVTIDRSVTRKDR